MLSWDLTNTRLARSDRPIAAPTEGELEVLLIGLLLAEGITYSELAEQTAELTNHNLDQVAGVIEQRLGVLVREFGSSSRLRERLGDCVGIKVGRTVHGGVGCNARSGSRRGAHGCHND